MNGHSELRFAPDDSITREQIAAIFYRYAAYKGYDTSAREDLSAFTDKPSSWALENMRWAVAEGLMQGKGDGLLDPSGYTKRSECATILKRFIEKY